MNKTELLTKGIEMDYEETLINEQKTQPILHFFVEFCRIFLRKNCIESIKFVNTPHKFKEKSKKELTEVSPSINPIIWGN